MREENHRFKRLVIAGDAEKAIVQKEKENAEKIRDYEWTEEMTKEANGEPMQYDANDVESCIARLVDDILNSLSLEHMENLDHGLCFSMPVDSSIHWLLSARFCEEWSLDSRLQMFTVIRDQLLSYFVDLDHLSRLDEKIQEIFPGTERKLPVFDSIDLLDDAMAVNDEVNSILIELRVKFAGHS